MPPPEDPLLFRRTPRNLPRRRLRAFASHLQQTVADGRRFCCLLTDDQELRRLNRQFLANDYPTDVIAFPEPGPDQFLGEIAISVQRAADQARRYGHRIDQEIGILMLHGLLHLLGMDHDNDHGKMARVETRWRKELDLPAGLVKRVRS
jgi:probable rRNA maturation factor